MEEKKLNTVLENPNKQGAMDSNLEPPKLSAHSMPLEDIGEPEEVIDGVIRLLNLAASVIDSLYESITNKKACAYFVC